MTFASEPSGLPLNGETSGFCTTCTAPGTGARPLPGSGTIAGIGVPATISPSGYARDPAAGVVLPSAHGVVWYVAPDTASRVPASNTSWLRQWYHMPCAKCG